MSYIINYRVVIVSNKLTVKKRINKLYYHIIYANIHYYCTHLFYFNILALSLATKIK